VKRDIVPKKEAKHNTADPGYISWAVPNSNKRTKWSVLETSSLPQRQWQMICRSQHSIKTILNASVGCEWCDVKRNTLLDISLRRNRIKAEESGGRKSAGSNPSKTVKNTIAGVSFIFASTVCVYAYAFNTNSSPDEDASIMMAGLVFFLSGLCFFIFAKDKPSQ